MKAQELYEQGFDLARKGQYKESVELSLKQLISILAFPKRIWFALMLKLY